MKKTGCFFGIGFMLLLCACAQKVDTIVGTWELPSEYISVIGEAPEEIEAADIRITYTFREDGTGEEYISVGEMEDNRTFTYIFTETEITVTYDDTGESCVPYEYVLDGDVLTLTMHGAQGQWQRKES